MFNVWGKIKELINLINNKEDKKIIYSNMYRNNYYYIGRASLNDTYSRISLFVDNSANYEKNAPAIFNVNSANEMECVKLYNVTINEGYLIKLLLYKDTNYKYLFMKTVNYCDKGNIELISKYGFDIKNQIMKKEEFDAFVADKTLVKEI